MNSRYILLALIVFSCGFLCPSRVGSVELNLNSGRRTADLVYLINTDGDISRLSFPVDNRFIGGELTHHLDFPVDFLDTNLAITLRHDELFKRESGTAKNTDLLSDGTDLDLTGNSFRYPGRTTHQGVDIYSESEGRLQEGSVTDGMVELTVFDPSSISIDLVGGLQHSEYTVTTHNLEQRGFGPYDTIGFTLAAEGLFITYHRETFFPYGGISGQWSLMENANLSFTAAKSYEVDVEDRDNHHSRKKLSESELSGEGELFKLGLTFFPQSKYSLLFRGESLQYEATGYQDQRWYGDPDPSDGYDPTGDEINNIPNKVTSDELSASVGIRYRW